MKIIKSADAIHVEKPEGTSVRYYLFNDYEVHYNDQAPNTTLTWHHHEQISETLYIIDGQLVAKWRENGKDYSEIVKSGDLIEVENTPHTFCNESDKNVRFLVIKRMPSGKNFKEIFKTDKVID